MVAKAEISYFETSNHWYWLVTVVNGQAEAMVSDVEPTYEDAIERVQYWLEELVDGNEVEP